MSNKKSKRNKNVGGGAEETVAKESQFATDGEANSALAETAKILNIKEGQEKAEAKKAAKAPKLTKDGRPKLPLLPRAASKSKPEVPCACGCGGMTKSKFVPGHDSRLRGWSLRIARKLVTMDQIPEGEREQVTAFIKELKKTPAAWDKLQNPQPQQPKKTAAATK